jgi:uncharacterized protein (TIGR03435 family)
MQLIRAVATCFVLTVASVAAQAVDGSWPMFDVVSIKASDPKSTTGGQRDDPAGYYLTNAPLLSLVLDAYPSLTAEVVGAPTWLFSEKYDVAARAATNPSSDERMMMLRALLRDRMAFKAHFERVKKSTFALVVARKDGRLGPQMRRVEVDCVARRAPGAAQSEPLVASNGAPVCGMSAGRGRIVSGGMTMDSLVRNLSNAAGGLVTNETALDGYFELTLEYTPPSRSLGGSQVRNAGSDLADPDVVSVFTALEEQLGLRLVPSSAVIEVLTIDQIARPTSN